MRKWHRVDNSGCGDRRVVVDCQLRMVLTEGDSSSSDSGDGEDISMTALLALTTQMLLQK